MVDLSSGSWVPAISLKVWRLGHPELDAKSPGPRDSTIRAGKPSLDSLQQLRSSIGIRHDNLCHHIWYSGFLSERSCWSWWFGDFDGIVVAGHVASRRCHRNGWTSFMDCRIGVDTIIPIARTCRAWFHAIALYLAFSTRSASSLAPLANSGL